MNKDYEHAGPQAGGYRGVGKGIDKQQDREHPDGGETTLDKVVAGLEEALGGDGKQGGERLIDENSKESKKNEIPVDAWQPYETDPFAAA